jgi:hypothetical protein
MNDDMYLWTSDDGLWPAVIVDKEYVVSWTEDIDLYKKKAGTLTPLVPVTPELCRAIDKAIEIERFSDAEYAMVRDWLDSMEAT